MPKFLLILTVVLFSLIGIASWLKKGKTNYSQSTSTSYEIVLEDDTFDDIDLDDSDVGENIEELEIEAVIAQGDLPHADRINEFFNLYGEKLPIVETITYRSKVDWQPGRAAWISDYARHYETSRHFIARSLNGKPDYLKQDVADGDQFNVLRKDKNFNFHLVVDILSSRIWFYYHDLDDKEWVLLKSYPVGLGRVDKTKLSGYLTPLGKYSLGSKVGIYKPGMYSYHNAERTEMIRIFGTRWIPFEKEMGDNTAPAKGLGIHGLPWLPSDEGILEENVTSLGKYESDGCIRLATKDIEELFSIIISRPTYIQIVKGFENAQLAEF